MCLHHPPIRGGAAPSAYHVQAQRQLQWLLFGAEPRAGFKRRSRKSSNGLSALPLALAVLAAAVLAAAVQVVAAEAVLAALLAAAVLAMLVASCVASLIIQKRLSPTESPRASRAGRSLRGGRRCPFLVDRFPRVKYKTAKGQGWPNSYLAYL